MNSLSAHFLVAKPILSDPNFRQTVVLILAHSEGGAFGVVVNRPAESSPLPVPLYQGGPCPSPGLILLHGVAEWAELPSGGDEDSAGKRQIAPGIFIGDASCVEKVKELEGAEKRVRAFRGYAGWGAGQVESEIAAGAWAIVQATAELLFDTPTDELWIRLVPNRIPEPSVN